MKKLMKTFLAVGATLTLLLVGGSPALAYAAPSGDVQRILEDTNAARASNGLPALVLNEQMTSVAQNWSQQQASEGKMYHNPNYSTQISGGWSGAAENVAYGYAVADVTTGWMNSEGHRKNILGDYNSIGIGVKDGYYTQVFAKYPNVGAPTQPAPAPEQPKPQPQPEVSQPKPAPEPAPVEEVKPTQEEVAPAVEEATETPAEEQPNEAGLVDPLVKTDKMAKTEAGDISAELDAPMTTMDGVEDGTETSSQGIPQPLLIGILVGASILLAVAVFFLLKILRKK